MTEPIYDRMFYVASHVAMTLAPGQPDIFVNSEANYDHYEFMIGRIIWSKSSRCGEAKGVSQLKIPQNGDLTETYFNVTDLETALRRIEDFNVDALQRTVNQPNRLGLYWSKVIASADREWGNFVNPLRSCSAELSLQGFSQGERLFSFAGRGAEVLSLHEMSRTFELPLPPPTRGDFVLTRSAAL
jgi:hypothetical protein